MVRRAPIRRAKPSGKVHGPKHRPSSNTVFAGGRQSHPRPTKKASPKKKHVVHKTKPSSNKSWSFLPQAHASSTQTSSTTGKFNPPGWTGQQDYGMQGVPSTKVTTGFGGKPKQKWHPTQKGKLGQLIADSKAANPQAWMTATGPKGLQQPQKQSPGNFDSRIEAYLASRGVTRDDPMYSYWSIHTDIPGTTYAQRVANMKSGGLGNIVNVAQQTPKVQQTKKVKTGATTWYATNAQGNTIKGEGKLSMQARQYYGDKGYNLITSKPPGQDAQQRLSDTTGVTTYTQWGDVSTVPRDLAGQKPNKIRVEQQKLSDKYNITTYNKDGSVSTVPRQQNQLAQDGIQQVGGSKDNAWWWQSPFSASAETDKKEKPWGWW